MPAPTKPCARNLHRLRDQAAFGGKISHSKRQSGVRGKWRGRGTPGAHGNPCKSENYALWEDSIAKDRIEIEDAHKRGTTVTETRRLVRAVTRQAKASKRLAAALSRP